MKSNPIPFSDKTTVDFSVLEKEWSNNKETVFFDYLGSGHKKAWWKCPGDLAYDTYLPSYTPNLMDSCYFLRAWDAGKVRWLKSRSVKGFYVS